jgi:tetratricopeptide (TPR) repeat protein
MNSAGFFVIIVLLFGNAGLCFAQAPEGNSEEATIESYRKAIKESKTNVEKADLYKKIGDLYVSKEDFKNAAEQFIKALSLKRDFPEQERVRMAVSISWGDQLDKAIGEFQSIVQENPENIEARIHLARTLSWAGKLDDSLLEIDNVLGQDPQNKHALLIKANDLRWKGEIDKALPLYRSILDKQDDFDTRIGYTAALFASGNDKAARESMARLKPVRPYQENELKKLQENISKPKSKSHGDAKFTHYRDTDGNEVNRYMASYGFSAGDWTNLFNYIHTAANDYIRRNKTDAVSGETRVGTTRKLGVGAGLGAIRYVNGDTTDFLIGHLRADAEFSKGTAGVNLSKEPLNETAELIENRILFTDAGAYFSRSLTERFSVYGRYNYKSYSDGNNSNDAQLALRYALVRENPRTTAGYRFRYLDFNRQSFGGYFDPSNFLSHQIFANISFKKGRFSGSAEVFAGHQSFTRYGTGNNDIVSGGAASLDYTLTRNIVIGVNGEGGDYALQTSTGFRYHLFGVRLGGQW